MSEEQATEAIHDLVEREARQRRFLETLLENAPVCIAVVAGQGLRYTLVNPAYQRLRPDLPLVGRTHLEAFPGAVEAQAVLRHVLRTGVPHEANGFPMPIPGKPDAAWDHRVAPLPRSEGEEPAVLVMAWDVTERERATRTLQAAHDTLRQLVEGSPFGVYLVDADLRLVLVSASAQRVLQNMRPLVGRDLAELLRILWPEPFATEAIERFRHTLATGEAYHAPGTVERRHDIGEVESYDWKIARVTLPDGRPGVVCHFYDLSERQRYEEALRESEARLRESEQRFKTMADTAPAKLWITDAWQRCTFVSRGWLEFTGQTLEEGLGTGWTQAVFEEDRERAHQAFLQAAARRESFQLDYRLRRADGELRWVVDSGRPRFDAEGHFLGYIGSVIDVHERKRAEQELQRLNAELSDESRRKDEFLATLAHELRNPLAPLRSSLELMKRARDNPAVVEKARATMERQLVQMVRLVDDLLDVSRISRDRLELQRERVDLASVVQSAVELCRPLCERAGHCLTITLPPEPISLFADPVRLSQVFGNLLTNACKYTEPGGRIRLSAERQGTDVVVSVEDNGVGIPPDMLSTVFDLFTQVDRSLERSGGGLGIGLSLVKRLVGMHGGTVTAHSEGPGHGSTFVVRLPALPT